MKVSDTDLRRAGRQDKPGSRAVKALLSLVVICAIAVAGWFLWVFGQIRYYATHDQARPADAIAVFGAAEYDGRPSPVLRARLDHALSLYREGLAPLIITLGGRSEERRVG